MHDIFPLLSSLFFTFSLLLRRAMNWNIFSEPITQIVGVPEGDIVGEIFINMGSTINITCIVRNLPEKSSMFWTHNNEVRFSFCLMFGFGWKHFVSKQKVLRFYCCCWWWWFWVNHCFKFIASQLKPSLYIFEASHKFSTKGFFTSLHDPKFS